MWVCGASCECVGPHVGVWGFVWDLVWVCGGHHVGVKPHVSIGAGNH